MTIRIITRLLLLLVALASATALFVGALSVLASNNGKTPLLVRDQTSAVGNAIGSINLVPAVAIFVGGILLVALFSPLGSRWLRHVLLLPVILGSTLCLSLARWMVERAVRRIPPPHRDRYEDEWLAELEYLEERQLPALRTAVGILLTARQTGRARRSHERDERRPSKQLSPWKRSLIVGVMTAIINLANIAAGIYPRVDAKPTVLQLSIAGLASVLAGGLASWQAIWQVVKDRANRRADND
jgi:hypothetical protein